MVGMAEDVDVLVLERETATAAATIAAASVAAVAVATHGLLDKDLPDLGRQRRLFADGLVRDNDTLLGLYGERRRG